MSIIANKAIIRNLRERWPEELRGFSDKAILALYEDFAYSDEFGENDKNFPLWFPMLLDYETKAGK